MALENLISKQEFSYRDPDRCPTIKGPFLLEYSQKY